MPISMLEMSKKERRKRNGKRPSTAERRPIGRLETGDTVRFSCSTGFLPSFVAECRSGPEWTKEADDDDDEDEDEDEEEEETHFGGFRHCCCCCCCCLFFSFLELPYFIIIFFSLTSFAAGTVNIFFLRPTTQATETETKIKMLVE